MIDVRPLDLSPQGLVDCARLLRSVWPQAAHITPAYLEWLYCRNPWGRAFGFNAVDAGRLIVHSPLLPIRGRLCGKPAEGTLSLHSAVDPRHQGKGLFFRITRRTYEAARERGCIFGLGIANARSTPGFVKLMGFRLLRPLDVRLGFGAIRYTRTSESEADFERLWDEDAARWRLASPTIPYAVSRTANGTLRIEGPSVSPAIPGVGVIVREFRGPALSLEPRPPAPPALRPCKLYVGIDPDIEWGRSCYVPLPMRLRPSPLNLIVKDIQGTGLTVDARHVRIWPLDFDDF